MLYILVIVINHCHDSSSYCSQYWFIGVVIGIGIMPFSMHKSWYKQSMLQLRSTRWLGPTLTLPEPEPAELRLRCEDKPLLVGKHSLNCRVANASQDDNVTKWDWCWIILIFVKSISSHDCFAIVIYDFNIYCHWKLMSNRNFNINLIELYHIYFIFIIYAYTLHLAM